jgi:hypothetical protein
MNKPQVPRCSVCEDCINPPGPSWAAKRICGKTGQKLNRKSKTSPMWCPKRREKLMPYEWDNYQALITVPATDDNFKSSLKNATDDELVRAIPVF